MNELAVVNLAFTMALLIMVHVNEKRATAANEEMVKNDEQLKEWLFISLYKINNSVLLPAEKEKEIIKKKARVYSPEDDPMSEFNGMRTDFLHKEEE